MMNKTKKKGYALAVVIIIALVMTIIVTAAFSILMRYMFWAKDDLQDIGGQVIYCGIWR